MATVNTAWDQVSNNIFKTWVIMFLFSLFIGRVQITLGNPLFLKSMRTAFIISSVLCFAGIFASIARGRAHQH